MDTRLGTVVISNEWFAFRELVPIFFRVLFSPLCVGPDKFRLHFVDRRLNSSHVVLGRASGHVQGSEFSAQKCVGRPIRSLTSFGAVASAVALFAASSIVYAADGARLRSGSASRGHACCRSLWPD